MCEKNQGRHEAALRHHGIFAYGYCVAKQMLVGTGDRQIREMGKWGRVKLPFLGIGGCALLRSCSIFADHAILYYYFEQQTLCAWRTREFAFSEE